MPTGVGESFWPDLRSRKMRKRAASAAPSLEVRGDLHEEPPRAAVRLVERDAFVTAQRLRELEVGRDVIQHRQAHAETGRRQRRIAGGRDVVADPAFVVEAVELIALPPIDQLAGWHAGVLQLDSAGPAFVADDVGRIVAPAPEWPAQAELL